MEITKRVGEMPWEVDQRLKCMIRKANIHLTDSQHHEWFIASLLPHLRIALSQRKIRTQAESLEIAMRLHEMPIQDASLEVQQILSQLQDQCLELQSFKKEKEARLEMCKEAWCLKCKSQGHDKDHCHVFANYITGG